MASVKVSPSDGSVGRNAIGLDEEAVRHAAAGDRVAVRLEDALAMGGAGEHLAGWSARQQLAAAGVEEGSLGNTDMASFSRLAVREKISNETGGGALNGGAPAAVLG